MTSIASTSFDPKYALGALSITNTITGSLAWLCNTATGLCARKVQQLKISNDPQSEKKQLLLRITAIAFATLTVIAATASVIGTAILGGAFVGGIVLTYCSSSKPVALVAATITATVITGGYGLQWKGWLEESIKPLFEDKPPHPPSSSTATTDLVPVDTLV